MTATDPRSPVVVAVDAGTGSARAIAFDLDGGIAAKAAREWTHGPVPGHPGGAVFDTTSGWDLIAQCLREITDALAGREIVAVGASSMREGFVLYDQHGGEIFACPNTDGRARSQADELVRRGAADRIYEVGGDWVSITAPSRLLWLAQEEPELLRQARALGMLSDWVTYRLTGEFTTDPTCGSSSALFDLSRRQWSAELADLVGLPTQILPEVFEGGTVVGRVTDEAAAQTHLPAGLPVVVGGADTQLALHGIGATSAAPTVVAGTFWQTTAVVDAPLVDKHRRLRTLCHVGPDTWMVEGIGFLSGLAMRWFRDAFCPDATATAQQSGTTAFDVMERWAADVPPGSNGVVAVLADVMQADAWHHAAPAFVNFDINDPAGHHRGTFVRAIEEAAAYVTRGHLEILDDLTDGAAGAAGRFTLAGGTSSGRLWPTILAEVTGAVVEPAVVPEATSYGTARLAAAGVGLDMPPAGCAENPIVPDPAAVATYETHYRAWFDVYSAQVRATEAAGMTPLFTPPGGLPYRPATASGRRSDNRKESADG